MIQLFKKANDKAGAEVDPKDPTKQKWNADTVYVKVENEMVPLSELAKHAKTNEYEAIQSVENEVEINGAVHNVADLVAQYQASKKNEESKDKKEADPDKETEKDIARKAKKNEESEDSGKAGGAAGAKEDNKDVVIKKNEDEKDKEKDNKKKEGEKSEEDDVEEKISKQNEEDDDKKEKKENKKDVRHFVRLNTARDNGHAGGSVLTIDTMLNRVERGKNRYGTNN